VVFLLRCLIKKKFIYQRRLRALAISIRRRPSFFENELNKKPASAFRAARWLNFKDLAKGKTPGLQFQSLML
jgi:hypothetical protein